MAVIGLFLGGVGILMILKERNGGNTESKQVSNRHGVKIISHDNESMAPVVPYSFTLKGISRKSFSPDALQVFVRDGDKYWPCSKPGECIVEGGKWRTEIYLGGKPGPRIVVVTIVGKTTIKDCKDYWRIGNENDIWEFIKAPNPDIEECDRLVVIKSE